MRRMTFNNFFNKISFQNTPPPFNGDRFELWKVRFKIFIHSFDFELWELITNGPFISTHHINEELIDKPDFLWTIEKKIKFEIDFKTNNSIMFVTNT